MNRRTASRRQTTRERQRVVRRSRADLCQQADDAFETHLQYRLLVPLGAHANGENRPIRLPQAGHFDSGVSLEVRARAADEYGGDTRANHLVIERERNGRTVASGVGDPAIQVHVEQLAWLRDCDRNSCDRQRRGALGRPVILRYLIADPSVAAASRPRRDRDPGRRTCRCPRARRARGANFDRA
jgi:hypothetical protein